MEHSPPQIAKDIEAIICLMNKGRKSLEGLGDTKARAIADYDLEMQKAILLRKEKQSVTIVRDLAKGDCQEKRYAMELANIRYSIAVKNLEVLQAALNAKQSIYRHLDET
jgi:hypothetical protein